MTQPHVASALVPLPQRAGGPFYWVSGRQVSYCILYPWLHCQLLYFVQLKQPRQLESNSSTVLLLVQHHFECPSVNLIILATIATRQQEQLKLATDYSRRSFYCALPSQQEWRPPLWQPHGEAKRLTAETIWRPIEFSRSIHLLLLLLQLLENWSAPNWRPLVVAQQQVGQQLQRRAAAAVIVASWARAGCSRNQVVVARRRIARPLAAGDLLALVFDVAGSL